MCLLYTRTIAAVCIELTNGNPDADTLQSLRSSLSEKLDTLKLLDDEILESLTEETAIGEEIDRSSQIRVYKQKSIFFR